MLKAIGIIPARYASTRFPGKPLAVFDGKTLIQRTYEQVMKAKSLGSVIISTDDERIVNHARDLGATVALTGDWRNGTERCAETMRKLGPMAHDPDQVVVNIQGDEAFINPEDIDRLVKEFEDCETEIATLIQPMTLLEEFTNPDIVKVVLNRKMEAIYFSRSLIPFCRNVIFTPSYYKHCGVYGYRAGVLQKLAKLPPCVMEQAEMLEQLRWIDSGLRIKTMLMSHQSVAIDSPADLRRAWNST